MVKNLLADRFRLAFHWEPREFPVYELTVDKGGAKLPPPSYPDGTCQSIPISFLVSFLQLDLATPGPNGRASARIEDKTGLTGLYDFKYEYASARPRSQLQRRPSGDRCQRSSRWAGHSNRAR